MAQDQFDYPRMVETALRAPTFRAARRIVAGVFFTIGYVMPIGVSAQSGTLTPFATNQPLTRPSFDCARAASPTERQICASPQLARLDAAMSQAFGRAKADKSFADQAKLMAEQQRWLQQRNACGADAACIEHSMTARIEALEADRGLDVDRSSNQLGPPNTPSSVGNAPAAAMQQRAQTSADLATKFETASAPEMIDLIQLLMAARPDLYRSDGAAVAVYGMLMQGEVQRCVATLKEMENELRRPPVIAEAHRQVEAVSAAASRSPTKLFRISTPVQLGQYDANANEFPLPPPISKACSGGIS